MKTSFWRSFNSSKQQEAIDKPKKGRLLPKLPKGAILESSATNLEDLGETIGVLSEERLTIGTEKTTTMKDLKVIITHLMQANDLYLTDV